MDDGASLQTIPLTAQRTRGEGHMASGRLPNLLVAGVPKAGTGSLFAYLSQHPDICRADEKEVGYWNYYNPRRHSGAPPPLDDYRKHFAACGSRPTVGVHRSGGGGCSNSSSRPPSRRPGKYLDAGTDRRTAVSYTHL